ncbi:MAG: AMP-binding protein [Proteobacteria bacterium]|nr:AMP-binding protein [Pseudomonadota bacterium]MBU1715094.1 AMP-binding protein [Pseudomonadota bacterium]
MTKQTETKITPGELETTNIANLLLETVRALITELHPNREGIGPVHLDSSLDRDLALDSLARVELIARLEKTFNIIIPEQVFSLAETPRDFLREILSSDKTQPSSNKELAEIITRQPVAEAAPFIARTLVEVLNWHVKKHPDRPHIRFYHDDNREDILTYGQLLEGAEKVAAGLQALNLNSQESVVIMLPSGREYFFSFFGTLLAGGVPVPLYPPGHLKQIEEHLHRHVAIADNSRAGVMISMPETVRFAKLLKTQVVSMRHVVTVEDLNQAATELTGPALRPALKPDDLAFLQYTSGSTGSPKGVMLTHANLLANIRSMGRTLKVDSDDVFISWLPLYHDMGLIGAWLGSLHYACQLVLMSPLTFISKPVRWLRAIHRYHGTLSAAPNFAYDLCLRRISDQEIGDLNLSSWRLAFNGAEAISPRTLNRFIDHFQPFGFKAETMLPVYGLAESSVGLAFPPLGRGPIIDRIDRPLFMSSGQATPSSEPETSLQFVNCGRPLPDHQIRIVDQTGREMPDRREGRIQFQGPSTTSGYFRNTAKTAELFDGQWLESGDRGYIADGDLYITGRSKDIVIRAGRNIYPEGIEEAIGKIEGIRAGNVAIFGSNDPDAGTERLVVLAESRKRQDQARELLRKKINEIVMEMTGMPPDEVIIALPNTVLKTSSGKIRRASCRDLYERGLINKPPRAVWFQVLRFTLSGIIPQLRQISRQVSSSLYAAYCWLLFGVGVIAGGFAAFLPLESWRWATIRAIIKSLFTISGIPLKISGLEHLPPPQAPCIFAANHASYLDGFVLLAGVPRLFSFVVKGELKDKLITRIMLGRINTEFVERFDKNQGVKDAARLLQQAKQGRSLLFLPEGTFMRMPGLLPFKMGAFETAVKGKIPVVPIAIRGTRSILRSDSWFPRHGSISLTIGQPITSDAPQPGPEKNEWNQALKLRETTRAWILQHCGEPDLAQVNPPLFNQSDPPLKPEIPLPVKN